jgi:hypothetical protein
MTHARLKKLEFFLMVALGFALFFLVARASAQTKTEVTNAAQAVAKELHCQADSTNNWDCFVCLAIPASVNTDGVVVAETRTLCGKGRVLKPGNAGKVQDVATALVANALKTGGYNVDAGQP